MSFWKLTESLIKFNHAVMVPFNRNMARMLFSLSKRIDPLDGFEVNIMPANHNQAIGNRIPHTKNALFVAPSAHIRGSVELNENSVVLFNCSIEAFPNRDTEKIQIGERTVIQELSLIKANKGESVNIGKECFIGANSRVVNSTIGNNVYLGPNSQIVNCIIEDGAYIAPGTCLEGVTVNKEEVYCKSPGEFLRMVTEEEKEYLLEKILEQQQLSLILSKEHSLPSLVSKLNREHLRTFDPAGSLQHKFDDLTELAGEMNIPTTKMDLEYADYRMWVMEDLESRRLMGAKNEDFEDIDWDMRPKELYGPFHPDLVKYDKISKEADQRKGKILTSPEISNRISYDYKEVIENKKDPKNKF